MRQTKGRHMTTEHRAPQTMPDQPAANSGAAVGFVLGGFVGIALALAVANQPWLNAYATPMQSVVGGCVAGTICGAIIGALRDRMQPKR
jgi:ABC-type uncharacterized transport system permease subunit